MEQMWLLKRIRPMALIFQPCQATEDQILAPAAMSTFRPDGNMA